MQPAFWCFPPVYKSNLLGCRTVCSVVVWAQVKAPDGCHQLTKPCLAENPQLNIENTTESFSFSLARVEHGRLQQLESHISLNPTHVLHHIVCLFCCLTRFNKVLNKSLIMNSLLNDSTLHAPVEDFRCCEIRNFPGGTKQQTLNELTPLSLLLGIGETCNVNHPSPSSCLFTASTGRAQDDSLR